MQESSELKARPFADRYQAPEGNAGRALLNVGCGEDGHSAFVNVDLIDGPGIVRHDLRQGIPFPDATYDLVYHSTLLSHLRPTDALNLMRECRRVLRPGGVLRVVTEDLEQMCRIYLEKLEAACSGDRQSEKDYEWMLLELYDQAAREYPGGGMAHYLSQDPLPNEAFICLRAGVQARRMVAGARRRRDQMAHQMASDGSPADIRSLLRRVRARARNLILTALLGRRGLQALTIGQFRLSSGQVSYRMYDRYSLEQLFLSAGFNHVSLRAANESAYTFWDEVNLDIDPEGQPARPHALIMEGIGSSVSAVGFLNLSLDLMYALG